MGYFVIKILLVNGTVRSQMALHSIQDQFVASRRNVIDGN